MLTRWAEFFEGENRRLSMARLLTFASWIPSTAILIYIRTVEALSIYLGAFVLNSVANKAIDVQGRKKNAKPDSSVSE